MPRTPPAPPWVQFGDIITKLDGLTTRFDAILARQGIPVPEVEVRPYQIIEEKLDQPLSWKEESYAGDQLTFSTDGSLMGIELKIDSLSMDAGIPLSRFNPIKYPARFRKFYLNAAAQPGKTLYIFLGREAGAEASADLAGAIGLVSGLPVNVSGALISAVVGLQSGTQVGLSGLQVITQSGVWVIADVEVIVSSGLNVVVQSGAPVSIQSGTYVNIGSVSGQGILISGQTVAVASGVGVTADIIPSTGVETRAILAVTGNSGGVTLVSGIVHSATVKSIAISADLYIGGATGINMPYSGYGLRLAMGEAITLNVNNFNLINVCAVVSGDPVSYIGVQ